MVELCIKILFQYVCFDFNKIGKVITVWRKSINKGTTHKIDKVLPTIFDKFILDQNKYRIFYKIYLIMRIGNTNL